MKVTYELLKFGLVQRGDKVTYLPTYGANGAIFEVQKVDFNEYDKSYTMWTVEKETDGSTMNRGYQFRPPSSSYTYDDRGDFEVAPESLDLVRLRILDLLETKGKAVQEFVELLRAMVKA